MNKISADQPELIIKDTMSITDSNKFEPISANEVETIVKNARKEQAAILAKMIRAIFSYLDGLITAVQDGVRAASTFEELSRLSDHDLNNIGIQRHEIAGVAFSGSVTRSTNADLGIYVSSIELGQPSNDWVKKRAA